MRIIDVSTLPYRDGIAIVNEQGVFYEQIQTDCEKTWENYNLINQNSGSLEVDKKNKMDFFNHLGQAKHENELALVTLDLCRKNVLREENVIETGEEAVNIKRFIIGEVVKIISNRRKELQENIKVEIRGFEELKNLPYECNFDNKQLKICTSPYNHIAYGEQEYFNTVYRTQGLYCTIYYESMILTGFYKPDIENVFEDLEFFNIESKIIGEYSNHYVKVVISYESNGIDAHNEVCKSFLSELYSKTDVQVLLIDLPIYISRYVLDQLLHTATEKQLIYDKSTEFLCDGLPKVFYVLTESHVIKNVRDGFYFKIFIDGKLLKCNV